MMDNILAITFDKKETENLERVYERSNCKTKNEFFELLVTRFFEELDEDAPFTLYFERNTTPTINRFIAFIEYKFGLNNNAPTMFNTTPFPFIRADVLTSMGKTYFARFNNETVSKLIELTNTCPNYNIMISNLLEAIIVTKVDSFDSDEKSCQEKMTMEKISKVKPDFDGDTLDIPKLDKKELSWNYMMNSGYCFNNNILSELIKTVTNRSDYVITSVEKTKKPKEYNRTIVLNTTSKKKQKQFADAFDYYKKTMMQLIERIVIETLIIREHCDPFIKCSIKISGLDIKTAINEIAKETGIEVITTKIPTAYKFVINAKTGEVFYPENIKIETN
jgi:hypothetical protein